MKVRLRSTWWRILSKLPLVVGTIAVYSFVALFHFITRPDDFQLTIDYKRQLALSTRAPFFPNKTADLRECINSTNPYCLKNNISYTIVPKELCAVKEPVRLLLATTSRRNNWEQRDLQRKHDRLLALPGLKRVFVIGVANDSYQEDINKEAARYGDILQGEVQESYRNIVLKTILGIQFFNRFCRNAAFYVKTDDDVVVSTKHLLTHLDNPQLKASPFLMGKCVFDRSVHRTKLARHFISSEQFFDATFPPFCEGSGYIMPSAVVQDLSHALFTLPVFPIEDSFVGAALSRLKYNITVHHEPKIFAFDYYLSQHPQLCKQLQTGAVLTVHCAGSNYLDYLLDCFHQHRENSTFISESFSLLPSI